MKNTSLGAFLCVPLMTLMFWQGSSCRSANTNMNKNSTANDNVSANVNVNAKANSNSKVSVNNNANANSNAAGNAGGTADMKGIWGGDQIAVNVTDDGATIEYPCAHGTITEKIAPDHNGDFVANGFHVNERPGPIRVGDDTKGQPAVYTGAIHGQSMTLTVKLSSANEPLGTFNVTQGKGGRVRKCL